MKTLHGFMAMASVAIMIAAGLPTKVEAGLPSLGAEPWLGTFAAFKGKDLQVGVSASGEMIISPVFKRGEVRPYVRVPVTFSLEESLPNGSTRLIALQPDSLASADPATDELEKTVITGSFEGGAEFELSIEQDRGVISVGGRITDPGTHTRNPIRFHVSARILNFYGLRKQELANDPKAFEALVSDDYVKLKWASGKRRKTGFVEPVDAGSEDVNGPGSEEAEVEIKVIDSRKFIFTASENSAITLSNRRVAPLNEGFAVNWTADAAKDPKGEARFSIRVKR